MRSRAQDEQLIGREREQAELRPVLAATRAGHGGLILLAGEAGVGKTCLAEDVLADADLSVLTGATYQDLVLPYGPIVTVLRSYLRTTPEGLHGCGPLAPYLALLLPELGAPPSGADRAMLFEAIRDAFTAIGRRRPTAVFLDDLHWADSATLDLLPMLAAALAQEPLLIIAAYRSDEIPRGHPLRRVRTDLRRAGRLREVVVEPLDATQTTDLAARILGGRPNTTLAATLFDRTQGLPFFVEELAAALVASGRLIHEPKSVGLALDADVTIPDSIRDTVLLRVEQLSGAAQQTLEIAAVAGPVFELDLVTELAGGDAGLVEVLECGLIREAGTGQGTFRHALTREAIYSALLWTRRRMLHREIAARLEARGTPPSVLAEHWLAVRDMERARQALLSAAQAAWAVHAQRDTARSLRRVLELWPDGADEQARLDVLDWLGRCAQLCGDLPEAIRVWREAADGHRLLGDTLRIATTQRHLAIVYELQGTTEQALAARLAAAEAFTASERPGEAATDRLMAAHHLQQSGSPGAALELIAAAIAEAEQAGRTDLKVQALGLEGRTLAGTGQVAEGIERLRAGLALALEAGLVAPAADIYVQLGFLLDRAADYAGARDAFLTGFDFCRQQDIPELAMTCLGCFAGTLQRTGEWERAMDVCREVLATDTIAPNWRVVATSVLAMIQAWRGETKRARTLMHEVGAQARRLGDHINVIMSAWTLAYLDDYEGAGDSAAEHYRFVLDTWQQVGERYLMIRPLLMATTFFARRNAGDDTRACAQALAELAATVANAESMAALAYALGEIALIEGEATQAVRHFREAASRLRELAVPFEVAQTQLRLGVALVAAGERAAGVAQFAEAYRTARKLGARPLAEQAARELGALGEPIERRLGRLAARQLEHNGLSRREREVLRLLAVGRTNREIAHELFLSARTVEMHVGSILAKLDCRSRADAARKASESGLLD